MSSEMLAGFTGDTQQGQKLNSGLPDPTVLVFSPVSSLLSPHGGPLGSSEPLTTGVPFSANKPGGGKFQSDNTNLQ